MNKSEIESFSKFAGLFTSPLRVRIVDLLLSGQMIVNEMVLELRESQAVISKQLGILREAGVVGCCPQGRCRQYGIPHPQETRKLIKLVHELQEKIEIRKKEVQDVKN